jgi:uncharacterized peroxidase-related enzyme
MTYLPSLPENSVLLDVFRAYPETARPLLDYHQALLRGPSPLSVAERELIAAYVSGLNACAYCSGVHRTVAQAFGIPEETITTALDDVDAAPVDKRMKPILRYVEKLTVAPSQMTSDDAARVLEAGWPEQALHDAVSVCALFNLMNRLVDGLGIAGGPDYFAISGGRLVDIEYTGLKDLI